MEPQEEVLKISAELWNKFLEIPQQELHLDDNNDFRHHLHAIQNIMYTQLFIKKHGKI